MFIYENDLEEGKRLTMQERDTINKGSKALDSRARAESGLSQNQILVAWDKKDGEDL